MNYIFYGIFALVCIVASCVVACIVSKVQKNKWRADTNAVFIKNMEHAQKEMAEFDAELNKEVEENEVDIQCLRTMLHAMSKRINCIIKDVLENEQEIADQLGHFTGEIFHVKQYVDKHIRLHTKDRKEADEKLMAEIKENDEAIAENVKAIKEARKAAEAGDMELEESVEIFVTILEDDIKKATAKLKELKARVKEVEKDDGCCKDEKPNKKPGKK